MRRRIVLGALMIACVAAAAASADSARTVLPTATPAGFEPLNFDALNARDWWMTGPYTCASSCEAILSTDDGGRSFTRIGSPPGGFDNVVFADAQDGYAFGIGTWSTHDGGRSWTQLTIGTGIDSLTVAGGFAYALVSHGGPPKLMRSPVSHDRWTTIRSGGPLMWSMLAQGETLLVQAGSHVLISDDQGEHLARGADLGTHSYCRFEPTGLVTELWALCDVTRSGNETELIRSANGGVSWTGVMAPAQTGLTAMAPATADTAVAGRQTLERTVNGGASWSAATGAPRASFWSELDFVSPTTGLALGVFGAGDTGRCLYETTDAGLTYRRVTL